MSEKIFSEKLEIGTKSAEFSVHSRPDPVLNDGIPGLPGDFLYIPSGDKRFIFNRLDRASPPFEIETDNVGTRLPDRLPRNPGFAESAKVGIPPKRPENIAEVTP